MDYEFREILLIFEIYTFYLVNTPNFNLIHPFFILISLKIYFSKKPLRRLILSKMHHNFTFSTSYTFLPTVSTYNWWRHNFSSSKITIFRQYPFFRKNLCEGWIYPTLPFLPYHPSIPSLLPSSGRSLGSSFRNASWLFYVIAIFRNLVRLVRWEGSRSSLFLLLISLIKTGTTPFLVLNISHYFTMVIP